MLGRGFAALDRFSTASAAADSAQKLMPGQFIRKGRPSEYGRSPV
jgi:hypothetical protein